MAVERASPYPHPTTAPGIGSHSLAAPPVMTTRAPHTSLAREQPSVSGVSRAPVEQALASVRQSESERKAMVRRAKELASGYEQGAIDALMLETVSAMSIDEAVPMTTAEHLNLSTVSNAGVSAGPPPALPSRAPLVSVVDVTDTDRVDADLFRRMVMAKCQQCVVSGCRVPLCIEAAHLLPYSRGDPRTVNHPSNGIMLRSDLHKMFDALPPLLRFAEQAPSASDRTFLCVGQCRDISRQCETDGGGGV